MVVNCEQVWLEVSNFVDGETSGELRLAIEEHLRGCRECRAVVDGTRNVVQLFGDERLLEVPFGYSERMQQRVAASLPRLVKSSPEQKRIVGPEANIGWTRRGFLGWAGAAVAAVVLAGVFEINKSSRSSQYPLQSQHAQPAAGIPPDMVVVAAFAGKIFHVPGCKFILDKDKTRRMTAREAMRDGLSPCVRCLKEYLINGPEPTSPV